MSAFIVSGGALLEVGAPSSLTRSTTTHAEFVDTIGGKRKGYVRRGGRREWSIDVATARPAKVATIEAISRHGAQVGWYGPEAAIGNLLSPQAVNFTPLPGRATSPELVALPDGSVATAVSRLEDGALYVGNAHGTVEYVPVRPGIPISAGAWAIGSFQPLLIWRDANLGALSSTAGAMSTGASWSWRSMTANPPTGAAFVGIAATTSRRFARPSIAWGSTSRREDGTGCPAAVIHSPAHSPVVLIPAANITKSSYTVTEVG